MKFEIAFLASGTASLIDRAESEIRRFMRSQTLAQLEEPSTARKPPPLLSTTPTRRS